jgi:hypothetical protein
LPGDVPTTPAYLSADLDLTRLAVLVAAELRPVVESALRRANLPALKPSTVERKRRAGYPAPSRPLVATGKLERSIRVERQREAIAVTVDPVLFYHPRFAVRLVDEAAVSAAIDRAAERWLEESVRFT